MDSINNEILDYFHIHHTINANASFFYVNHFDFQGFLQYINSTAKNPPSNSHNTIGPQIMKLYFKGKQHIFFML